MSQFNGIYDETYRPTYAVRDESYMGPDDSHVPRYHLHRVVPTGGMSWGVTTYTTKKAADAAAAALNELCFQEVP